MLTPHLLAKIRNPGTILYTAEPWLGVPSAFAALLRGVLAPFSEVGREIGSPYFMNERLRFSELSSDPRQRGSVRARTISLFPARCLRHRVCLMFLQVDFPGSSECCVYCYENLTHLNVCVCVHICKYT